MSEHLLSSFFPIDHITPAMEQGSLKPDQNERGDYDSKTSERR